MGSIQPQISNIKESDQYLTYSYSMFRQFSSIIKRSRCQTFMFSPLQLKAYYIKISYHKCD